MPSKLREVGLAEDAARWRLDEDVHAVSDLSTEALEGASFGTRTGAEICACGLRVPVDTYGTAVLLLERIPEVEKENTNG